MQLNSTLAIFNLGGGEIILILAIALILFGGKKLPELARGLGQGIREFKMAANNAPAETGHASEENRTPPGKLLPSAARDPQRIISEASANSKP